MILFDASPAIERTEDCGGEKRKLKKIPNNRSKIKTDAWILLTLETLKVKARMYLLPATAGLLESRVRCSRIAFLRCGGVETRGTLFRTSIFPICSDQKSLRHCSHRSRCSYSADRLSFDNSWSIAWPKRCCASRQCKV